MFIFVIEIYVHSPMQIVCTVGFPDDLLDYYNMKMGRKILNAEIEGGVGVAGRQGELSRNCM